MTTIAWTPGCFAADTCVTHEDGDGNPGHRTFAQKLQLRRLKPSRGAPEQVIALASKGDASAGTALDELVLEQLIACLRSRSRTPLERAMNRAALVRRRREITRDVEVAQLITWWHDETDECFLIEEHGLFKAVTEPYIAIGCDAAAAYGSLRAGKDALFAVESAALYGCYTSKPIHYLIRSADGVEFRTLT